MLSNIGIAMLFILPLIVVGMSVAFGKKGCAVSIAALAIFLVYNRGYFDLPVGEWNPNIVEEFAVYLSFALFYWFILAAALGRRV